MSEARLETMPVHMACTVYPGAPVVTYIDDTEAMVTIKLGDYDITQLNLQFHDLEVLQRLRGAVDETVRILAARIAYIAALP